MDTTGRFGEWRFSPFELIAGGFSLASVAVSITLWSVSKFQSKDDAQEVKVYLEKRIDGVETEVRSLRAAIDGVAKDTAYIRGRLEPKVEK